MRAAACEAETVALLEYPAFGIDGEFHLARDNKARFLAVMRIEFIAGVSAGLHVHKEQIETAVRSGRTEQLLGNPAAPKVQFGALPLARDDSIGWIACVLL